MVLYLSLVFVEGRNYVDKEATHLFFAISTQWKIIFKYHLFRTFTLVRYNEISMSAKSTPPIDLLYSLPGQLTFIFFFGFTSNLSTVVDVSTPAQFKPIRTPLPSYHFTKWKPKFWSRGQSKLRPPCFNYFSADSGH